MQVYIWGFSDETMPEWPPDFELVSRTDWPADDSPVVVSSQAAARFQAVVGPQLRSHGQAPTAILYLHRETAVPAEVSAAFTATVDEQDWETLRALLAGPERFQLVALAHVIPGTWLKHQTRPLDELDPEDLPLPPAVRRTLATHPDAWQDFLHILEERVWLRQHLTRP